MTTTTTTTKRASLISLVFTILTLFLILSPDSISAQKPKKSSSSSSSSADSQLPRYISLASKNGGLLEINSPQEFQKLVATPRSYSVSTLLTATEGPIKCQPCDTFAPEYSSVARGWSKTKYTDRHIFAKLEFVKGQQIFQSFQLQHAPALYFFPATTGPFASPSTDPVSYDFNTAGFDGQQLAATISKSLGVKVPYSKPFPWKIFVIASSSMFLISCFLMLVLPRLNLQFSILSGSKFLWMIVSLVTIVVMTSGYMFNSIRNTPYVGFGQGGRPEYFSGGFQSQYRAETQIVAGLYGLLAFSFVALTVLVPAQRDPARQRAGVYVWSAVFLGALSVLFAIFRIKNPSYPFRLFF